MRSVCANGIVVAYWLHSVDICIWMIQVVQVAISTMERGLEVLHPVDQRLQTGVWISHGSIVLLLVDIRYGSVLLPTD